jgi:hypothetical protein
MTATRNKLYTLVLVACAAGYGWLAYHTWSSYKPTDFSFCWIKATTGYPCPACGTTRSVDALLQGEWGLALQLNPFGLPVLLIMLVAPVWIGMDLLKRSDSFFRMYQAVERKLSAKGIALPLIALIVANWIWNIYKGY